MVVDLDKSVQVVKKLKLVGTPLKIFKNTAFIKVSFLFAFAFINIHLELINPFHPTGRFLYPLETSENQKVFAVFVGYRKIPVACQCVSQKETSELM